MIFHLILSNLNNVFVRYQIFFFFPEKICSSCHIFNACVQIQIYIYIYIYVHLMFSKILNYWVSFHVKKFYLKFLSIRELRSFIY